MVNASYTPLYGERSNVARNYTGLEREHFNAIPVIQSNTPLGGENVDVTTDFFVRHGTTKGAIFLVMLAIFSLIGIVGNSVALSVFWSRLRKAAKFTFRNHYNFFTCALAVADILVCCLRIPNELLMNFRLVKDEVLCAILGNVSQTTVMFASTIHIGLCVERYYAVCMPRSPFSVRQLRISIGAIAAVSIVLSIPSWWIYTIYSHLPNESKKVVGCHRDHGTRLLLDYFTALAILMLLSVLAALALYGYMFHVILNRLIGPKIVAATTGCVSDELNSGSCQRQKSRRRISCINLRRRFSVTSRIAFMFFIVTLVFYISWIPYLLDTLEIVQCDIFLVNAHFLTSSTNFMIYLAFNQRIRKETVAKLSLKKTDQMVSSSTSQVGSGDGDAVDADLEAEAMSDDQEEFKKSGSEVKHYKPKYIKRTQKCVLVS